MHTKKLTKIQLKKITLKRSCSPPRSILRVEKISDPQSVKPLVQSIKALHSVLKELPFLGGKQPNRIKALDRVHLESLSRSELMRMHVSLLTEYTEAIKYMNAPVEARIKGILVKEDDEKKQSTTTNKNELSCTNSNANAGAKDNSNMRANRGAEIIARQKSTIQSRISLNLALKKVRHDTIFLKNRASELHGLLGESHKDYKGLIIQSSSVRNHSTSNNIDEYGAKNWLVLPKLEARKHRRAHAKLCKSTNNNDSSSSINNSNERLKETDSHFCLNDIKEWNNNDYLDKSTYFDEFLDMSISKIGFQHKYKPYHICSSSYANNT